MIGVVGLGRIGSCLAARLLDAGHALVVYDVMPEAMRPLVERGAAAATSVAELAARAPEIITSLPGPAEVDTVVAGPGGILTAAPPGALVVETSTIGVAQSRDLATRCRRQGIGFLDAPVSGGVESARAGTLTVMAGGDERDLARARPYLNAFAAHVYHLGPSGSGATAKLLNQIVYLSYAAVFCEVTAFAARDGLDVPTLVDVLRRSVAGSPLMTGWERHLESGDFTPGFHIRRALKDLGLGSEAYAAGDYEAPVFAAALAAFENASAAGYAGCDIAALHASRARSKEAV